MQRTSALLIAGLLAFFPLTAEAQDRGRGDRDRDQGRVARERQQEQRPGVSMAEAVRRASSGREGRFLGASNRGGTVVVRWEYPGGRIADILVDGRTGRVIGER
jgi:hypothetical protein